MVSNPSNMVRSFAKAKAVVGAQEKETRSVNIRNRDDQETQAKGELVPLDEAIGKLKALKKERRLVNAI